MAAYFAVQLIGKEIDYRSLASEMQRIARAAGETPDEGLAGQVRTKAAELGLPAAAGAATIRRLPGNRISLTVQYPDSLVFFGRWSWGWNRRIEIDQTFTRY